jgi:hypothetical protein
LLELFHKMMFIYIHVANSISSFDIKNKPKASHDDMEMV